MNSPLRISSALAVLALALAGCGPTGGGTGGATTFAPEDFGATTASVCLSSVGAVLQCTVTGTTDAGSLDTPVNRPNWVGSWAGQRVSVVFEGSLVRLSVGCTQQAFAGAWGRRPNGTGAYFGGWKSESATAEQAAVMSVLPLTGGTLEVAVTLDDGRVVAGPLMLAESSAPPPVSLCP